MRKCLLAFLFAICIAPVFSQQVFPGELKVGDPIFNRPEVGIPPSTLSEAAMKVHYNVLTINVPVAGTVTFTSSSIWDNFGILYSTAGFDPASPLANALVAKDDLGGPSFGFTYNFATAGTYYLVVCSFKDDVTGIYTVTQSATTILPLKLLSFSAANAGGKSNIINWLSAEESNLNSYQVQRSNDNNSFNDLTDGNITAKNSAANISYNFMDNYPVIGYNYYRLKITERSGAISFGPIAVVKNFKPGSADMKIFPNPASNYVQIEMKSMQNKKATVSVINAGGAVILKRQYSFDTKGVLSVEINQLPRGKYFLTTTIDKQESTTSFIKN